MRKNEQNDCEKREVSSQRGRRTWRQPLTAFSAALSLSATLRPVSPWPWPWPRPKSRRAGVERMEQLAREGSGGQQGRGYRRTLCGATLESKTASLTASRRRRRRRSCFWWEWFFLAQSRFLLFLAKLHVLNSNFKENEMNLLNMFLSTWVRCISLVKGTWIWKGRIIINIETKSISISPRGYFSTFLLQVAGILQLPREITSLDKVAQGRGTKRGRTTITKDCC